MTGKVPIIGYGSPLRGDDRIAQPVAQPFANDAPIDCTNAIGCRWLTSELAERIPAVDLVVFVDARVDIDPGGVVVRENHGGLALPSRRSIKRTDGMPERRAIVAAGCADKVKA